MKRSTFKGPTMYKYMTRVSLVCAIALTGCATQPLMSTHYDLPLEYPLPPTQQEYQVGAADTFPILRLDTIERKKNHASKYNEFGPFTIPIEGKYVTTDVCFHPDNSVDEVCRIRSAELLGELFYMHPTLFMTHFDRYMNERTYVQYVRESDGATVRVLFRKNAINALGKDEASGSNIPKIHGYLYNTGNMLQKQGWCVAEDAKYHRMTLDPVNYYYCTAANGFRVLFSDSKSMNDIPINAAPHVRFFQFLTRLPASAVYHFDDDQERHWFYNRVEQSIDTGAAHHEKIRFELYTSFKDNDVTSPRLRISVFSASQYANNALTITDTNLGHATKLELEPYFVEEYTRDRVDVRVFDLPWSDVNIGHPAAFMKRSFAMDFYQHADLDIRGKQSMKEFLDAVVWLRVGKKLQ